MNNITTSNAITCAVGTIGLMSTADQIQQWLYIAVIAISAIATIAGLINSWVHAHKVDTDELNKLKDDLDKLEEATKPNKDQEDKD